MDSLISIPDNNWIGEVANNLIDKLSNAIGWISNKKTTNQIAKETLINEIESDKVLSPLEKYAYVTNLKKITKEYINQNDIVENAIQYLSEDSNPKGVDDDFLNIFMDKARLVSDKDFQFIWSRILAEECNNNNSVPKNLLYILERMDRKDAEAFLCLSKFVLHFNEDISLLIDLRRIEYYYSNGCTYGDFVRLDKLGLIEKAFETFASGYEHELIYENDNLIKVSYGNNSRTLPHKMSSIRIGNVIFTEEGSALFKSIESNTEPSFWNEIITPWLNNAIDNFEKK